MVVMVQIKNVWLLCYFSLAFEAARSTKYLQSLLTWASVLTKGMFKEIQIGRFQDAQFILWKGQRSVLHTSHPIKSRLKYCEFTGGDQTQAELKKSQKTACISSLHPPLSLILLGNFDQVILWSSSHPLKLEAAKEKAWYNQPSRFSLLIEDQTIPFQP